MKTTKIIRISEANIESDVIPLLENGGVVAFPTDTVYGIGCLVNNNSSIQRLYEIKIREETKAIPVLIGDINQLDLMAESISNNSQILARTLWPGALTLVVIKRKDLPESLSIYPTIGVRMPDHDWFRNLMKQTGPLAVTSANISGVQPAKNADEVRAQLDGHVDLIIDGGVCEGGVPSTVVDCTNDSIKVLREGAIPTEIIFKTLGHKPR